MRYSPCCLPIVSSVISLPAGQPSVRGSVISLSAGQPIVSSVISLPAGQPSVRRSVISLPAGQPSVRGSVISWPTGLPSVRRSVISWPTGLPSVRRSVKPSVQRWGLVHEEAGQSQGSDHRSFWTETKHKLKNSLNLCTVHKYVWLLYLS